MKPNQFELSSSNLNLYPHSLVFQNDVEYGLIQMDGKRFLAILEEYKNAPEVTKKRMYLETMEEIMPGVESVYIMDKDQQGPLPLLNLTQGSSSALPPSK